VQFSLSGLVLDTAFRGIPDARLEVVDGPQASVFAMTNQLGHFEMPGTFSGTMTLRASKEGYLPASKTVEAPGNLRKQSLNFELETSAPTVEMTGEYILTLTADSACTALPEGARKRTYLARIVPESQPTSSHKYQVVLSGATFSNSSNSYDGVGMGVSGTFARLVIGDYGWGISEEVASGHVGIWGIADASVSGSSISGLLEGSFQYCSSPMIGQGGPYWGCPVPPAECGSSNHRMTLTRHAFN